MMIRAIVACAALLAACETIQSPDPFSGLPIAIDGSVESDGVAIDAGSSGVPAGAGFVQFVARARVPQGTWSLTATAEGALALAAADGGLVSRSFQSDGVTPSVVRLALTIVNPVGSGVIHASVGSVTRDFEFSVTPISAGTSLCIDDADGGCLAETTTGTAQTVIDGGLEKIAVGGPSPSLRQGERILLRVTPAARPAVAGESWPCVVTAQGAMALLVDGGTAAAETVPVTNAEGDLLLPALLQGSGPAVVSATIGGGATSTHTFNVGSQAYTVSEVDFLGHAGVVARNQVTVCTATAGVPVSASLLLDAGTLASQVVVTATAEPSRCPAPFNGQAAFVWEGDDPVVTWSFAPDAGPAAAVQVVNMLGTDLCLAPVSATSRWTDSPDGGAAGPAVAVSALLHRNAFGTLCSDAGVPDGGLEPVVQTTLQLRFPAGSVPATAMVATDLNGAAVFDFQAPPGSASAVIEINAGGLISTSVAVARSPEP